MLVCNFDIFSRKKIFKRTKKLLSEIGNTKLRLFGKYWQKVEFFNFSTRWLQKSERKKINLTVRCSSNCKISVVSKSPDVNLCNTILSQSSNDVVNFLYATTHWSLLESILNFNCWKSSLTVFILSARVLVLASRFAWSILLAKDCKLGSLPSSSIVIV